MGLMGGGSGFGARVLVAVIVVSAGIVAGSAPAAAAAAVEEPTVVLTSDRVFDGQRVGMDISHFPSGWSAVVQCAGSVLEPDVPGTSVCAIRQMLVSDGFPPSHVDWTVASTFTTYDGTRVVDCRTEPSGCVAGVATVSDPSDLTSIIAEAYVPITFLPGLRVTPHRLLTDGATVIVEADHVPAGTWSIAQCGQAVVDDPTAEQLAAWCGPATPVTVAGDGTFAAELTVHDPLTSRGGATVPCGVDGCVVALTSDDDPVVRGFGIVFGGPTLDVEPATDIPEEASVFVTVGGAPYGAEVRQCVLPVGDTLSSSRCDYPSYIPLDENGDAYTPIYPLSVMYLEGEPVDCRVEDCALVMFDASGERLVEPVPISFAPPPTLTIEPSEGLLDGQDMTVVAEHLAPNEAYFMAYCTEWPICEALGTPEVGPDGRVEMTVAARQQFTPVYLGAPVSPVYCRANCSIVLTRTVPVGRLYQVAYTMAEGDLSVTPATGLSDGQQVQVTGSELMPSYAGVPVGPFATGGWALTQCDRAVLDQADLFGVFTHCSVAPPTRAVTIDGSTLDTTLDVQATITKILGGTTNCTADPGACVVGLVRLEQDMSLSTHLMPVTFD
jgi:hypothetical protein